MTEVATKLDIEIRRVEEDEDETTEIVAPSQADNQEHAGKLAQETAEREKSIVRLYIVGGDGHFHEPIPAGDFYPVAHWISEAIKSLPEKVELVYVNYDDKLYDDQIKWALDGDMDKVAESMDDWRSENEWYSVNELLKDNLPDEAREHFNEVTSSEEFDRFREECWNRDESTPFEDLARNTPNVQIRYYLDHDCPDYTAYGGEGDGALTEATRELAEAAGIDHEENEKALRSLLLNASYGGQLCVLHNSDIEDAISVLDGGTVTFTDPHLLVYDGFNGSGHEEQVEGTVTVTIDDNHPMRHDYGRMSWSDDIAGVVHSYFETPAEFTPKQKED